MQATVYIIAAAISTAMWTGSYHAAAASYHMAQNAGLMPSLHIRLTLAALFG